MNKEDLKHGDIVFFHNKLIRVNKGTRRREWIEAGSKYTRGILIGIRHLTNGNWKTDSWESGENERYYQPDQKVTAALVSTDMKSKPIYVFLRSIINYERT